MSLGSLVLPDSVEKRGLARRPKNRKAIDVEAFEGGVEQNMLNRKGFFCYFCFGKSFIQHGFLEAVWSVF